MATPLQDFRSKYPQYNEIDDEKLGDMLYRKYYGSQMSRDDFRRSVGLHVEPPKMDPSMQERLDKALYEINQPKGFRSMQEIFDDRMEELQLGTFNFDEAQFADWEAAQRGDLNNSLRLAAERGSKLLGHASRGIIGKPGDWLEENVADLGRIAFGTEWGPDDPADGKFRVRWMSGKEYKELNRIYGRDENYGNLFTEVIPNKLIPADFGGVPRHTTEKIKEAYNNGELGGTISSVINFGLEQGIQSIPDMVSVMTGVGTVAYVGARADEMADERAKNKGMEESTIQENIEALPAAIGSALFEKFGAKYIFGKFGKGATPDKLGQEILEAGLAKVALNTLKEGGKAAGVEATTEFFQEGIIEYLGEKLGTDAPMSYEEALERGFFGAIGGGVSGGTMGGIAYAGGVSLQAGKEQLENAGYISPRELNVDANVEEQIAQQAALDALNPNREGDTNLRLQDQPETKTTQVPDYDINELPDYDEEMARRQNPTEERPARDPNPEPTVPRETANNAPDPDTTPSGPEYFDPRMKRDVFRYNLAGMADDLIEHGGVAYVRDENDRIKGRTPSLNPSWFQEMAGTDMEMSTNQVRKAVEKALQGQRLGVRQARVVEHMLDNITTDRTAPPNMAYAREQLESARKARQMARINAQNQVEGNLDPIDQWEQDHAGELFKETDYLAEMDGEARIVDELAYQLDQWGLGDRVDNILKSAENTQHAIQMLEVLRHVNRQVPSNEQGTTAARPTIAEAAQATQLTTDRQTAAAVETQGQLDQTGIDFLDTDKRLYQTTADPRQVLGDRAEELNQYDKISTFTPRMGEFTVWYKPGEEQTARELIRTYQLPESRDLKIEADKHYQRGLLYDYGEENAAAFRDNFEQKAQYDEENGWFTPYDPDFTAHPSDRRTESRGEDRRHDTRRRERVGSMTPDQILDELYTDPLTGLGNERAFNEDVEHAAAVVAIDADGLGGVNDHLGHDIGDAMLQAVGNAISMTGARGYHKSGDEFYILADDATQARQAADMATKILQRQVLEASNGKLQGINITTGVGTNRKTADTEMEANKKIREKEGLRNPKGTLPPGGVLYSTAGVLDAPGNNYVGLIGKNGELPLDPNGAYQLGNGRTVNIPDKPVRRHLIIKLLERKFGNKIYDGRVKGKSRLGFYRQGIGEIRTKSKNDLEVTAHELAHWIDDRFPWVARLYKKHSKEMKGVSYDKEKVFEGYAEFMRLWFTQEHRAREAAPSFYDAWMKELENHKEIKDVTFDLQEKMHAWYLQGARKRLQDRIGSDIPLQDRVRNALRGVGDRILQKTFDELRPFKEAERAIRGEVGKTKNSGYNSLRLARGVHGVMEAIFHRGTINWNENRDLDFTGKGLKDIFDPVSDRMEEMQLYMVARRAQELAEQGRENLIREDEIRRGLRFGEEDPQLAEVFDEWLQFNKRMMDFYEESGILSPTSRAAIEEANKNYVPFNRVIESVQGQRVRNRGGSPFMRLKGGSQNINDVFDNVVSNTAHLVHMALVNEGKKNFYQMIDKSDNQSAANYAVPIAKDVKPTSVQKEQILKKILDGLGLNMKWYRMAETGMFASDAEEAVFQLIQTTYDAMEPMVTFFQAGQDPTGDVDFYYDNGVKKFYEIGDPGLMEAINHIGPRAHNLAASVLGGFSTALRRGVTLTPTFQIKNFIRDTMNAFTLSKGKMVPAAAATKALVERIYNDEHYWDYMINGGGFASVVEGSDINRDRVLDTRKKILRHLDKGLSAFEYANRIAEFKKLKEKGWNKRDAALAGREISTDFAMRGSSEALRWITTSVPFLNARLQGLYRNGREVMRVENGKMRINGQQAFNYAMRSLIAITIPSLVLYMFNKDDERYQELPDWIRDLSWVLFTGEGEDDYVMIPKPFETGMLWGSMPERMIENMYSNNDKELADAMLWMTMEVFNMNVVPQIYKPFDDLKKNENFTGAPIIPEYLEDVEPMEQYRTYTSDAMVALGRKYNISPIKAEYLVRGYFGTLGTWSLGLADNLVGDVTNSGEKPTKGWKDNILVSPFVNDGPLKRTHSEDHIYEMLKDTQVVVNTVRQITNRSPERMEQYFSQPKKQVLFGLNEALRGAAQAMKEINNAMDMVKSDATLTGDQKREQLQELQRGKNQITREVYQNINPEAVQKLIDEAEAAAGNATR